MWLFINNESYGRRTRCIWKVNFKGLHNAKFHSTKNFEKMKRNDDQQQKQQQEYNECGAAVSIFSFWVNSGGYYGELYVAFGHFEYFEWKVESFLNSLV